MSALHTAVVDFVRDENGATAIEYSVIAGMTGTLLLSLVNMMATFGQDFITTSETLSQAITGRDLSP